HAALRATADVTQHAHQQARRALVEAHRQHDQRLARFGRLARTPDPQGRLAAVERDLAATEQQLAAAQQRITRLAAEPVLSAEGADRLARERDAWRAACDAERTRRRPARPAPTVSTGAVARPQ